jgi:hypothetical protein
MARRSRSKEGLFAAAALAVVGVITACGDDDSESTSIVSPEDACDDAANALCDKLQECAPFFITIAFPNRDACVTRFKINCPTSFNAPGTSANPLQLSQCASAAKTALCEDILARKPPESCRTALGKLPDGNVCGHNAQCSGKLCRIAKGSTCGACSSLGAAGTACEREDECDYGLDCVDKKCLARGLKGASCSATAPCVATFGCVNGVCSPPLASGAACEFKKDENPCDGAKGFYCSPRTRTCTQFSTATPGGQCELSLQNITVCTAGSECKIGVGATTGPCEAAAADGAACNESTGPKCQGPARCAGGVCTITDPSKCN